MANLWKVISQDGNPAEAGDYECIVIYEDYVKKLATIEERHFSEDKTWSGRYTDMNEMIYAWSPDTYKTVDLPDGVEWESWVF